jgi:phenolic acid decarboxylase
MKNQTAKTETMILTGKFTEITNFLFQQLAPGEICRFGNGWLLKCPDCENLVKLDDTYKTFSTQSRDHYRITPSFVCPNEKCNYHRMVTISPEITKENEETVKENNITNLTEDYNFFDE